jgi:Ca-activated chloride channel family protein
MNGELDHEKALFRAEEPIVPRATARREAIAAAMAQFSKKNSRTAQGMRTENRLMNRLKGFIQRSISMQSIRLSHALMAGTSIAVLGLVVLNVSHMPGMVAVNEPENVVETPPVTPPVQDEGRSRQDGQLAIGKAEEKAKADASAKAQQPVTQSSAVLSQDEAESAVAPPSAPAEVIDLLEMKQTARGQGITIAPAPEGDMTVPGYHDQGRDKFADIKTNPVKVTAEEPVSTFSIDVDTASYSFVRSSLNNGVLPQKDAVRVEEMINYFPYTYAGPTDRSEPFKTTVSLMATPWNPDTKLMHVAIKGFSLDGQERPRSNLVFLLDTSGSMEEPNKLPLLRNSLKMLTETLSPDDTVSIVVYAGSAGTVLEPTKVKDKAKILAALDNLSAGGSTAGAEGIRQAYQLAEQNFDKAGVNRVILATDGDFNVGITDPEELKSFVERKRGSGVFLSVLGFGRGNYNDELMQALAQNGNGTASYIDTLNEARKVLVDEASSTLFPIAKDVKIQVEFNPQAVSEYRLIGYETRLLNREDFNNDKVDAGEIGAGHSVTALYEITPANSTAKLVDPLRYGKAEPSAGGGEYAFVKLRYKLPNEETSKLITQPVSAANEAASKEATFAAAVAAFGQLLRGGQYTKSFTYDDVITLALSAKGDDPFGYRAEFINLVRTAKTAQGLEPLNP